MDTRHLQLPQQPAGGRQRLTDHAMVGIVMVPRVIVARMIVAGRFAGDLPRRRLRVPLPTTRCGLGIARMVAAVTVADDRIDRCDTIGRRFHLGRGRTRCFTLACRYVQPRRDVSQGKAAAEQNGEEGSEHRSHEATFAWVGSLGQSGPTKDDCYALR